MVISVSPSTVSVPWEIPGGSVALLDYLDIRFPWIGRQEWTRRIQRKLILREDRTPFTLAASLEAGTKVLYYREVDAEPLLPFKEKILFHSLILFLLLVQLFDRVFQGEFVKTSGLIFIPK